MFECEAQIRKIAKTEKKAFSFKFLFLASDKKYIFCCWQGEDPFSMRNILFMGLKLFLAIAGGSPSNIEKADSSPMQVTTHSFYSS
jgi:hypothetical protein